MEIVNLPSGSVTAVGALDVFVDNLTAVPEPSAPVIGLLAAAILAYRSQRRTGIF